MISREMEVCEGKLEASLQQYLEALISEVACVVGLWHPSLHSLQGDGRDVVASLPYPLVACVPDMACDHHFCQETYHLIQWKKTLANGVRCFVHEVVCALVVASHPCEVHYLDVLVCALVVASLPYEAHCDVVEAFLPWKVFHRSLKNGVHEVACAFVVASLPYVHCALVVASLPWKVYHPTQTIGVHVVACVLVVVSLPYEPHCGLAVASLPWKVFHPTPTTGVHVVAYALVVASLPCEVHCAFVVASLPCEVRHALGVASLRWVFHPTLTIGVHEVACVSVENFYPLVAYHPILRRMTLTNDVQRFVHGEVCAHDACEVARLAFLCAPAVAFLPYEAHCALVAISLP
ncbi:hypothetical protein RchiOBHm_Chr4g0392681 [Rosa chinensis]|uniref:Uncharacterized protein n=1 Tax=Rosa chinensis TaxID=74649 RepID=A0A2P6QQT3_ROSCH|nr:hypothetical protein RchiOBHm_Chr4g0392681 [Rosa chinensis]